jgi:hypothetical protein
LQWLDAPPARLHRNVEWRRELILAGAGPRHIDRLGRGVVPVSLPAGERSARRGQAGSNAVSLRGPIGDRAQDTAVGLIYERRLGWKEQHQDLASGCRHCGVDGGAGRRGESQSVCLEAPVNGVNGVVNRRVEDRKGPRLHHRIGSLGRCEGVEGDRVPVSYCIAMGRVG